MIFKKIYLSDDNSVTLDCYLYEESQEMKNRVTRPAVVVCPGGGYFICSDREADPIALGYSAAGFHSFVLRYSLKEKAAFPKPLLDLCSAMKLIREKAEEWGVIKDQIAVVGFSAGGHLAASLGVHWNKEEIQKLSSCENEENKPNALILGYPVISTSWLERGSLARIVGDRDFETTYKELNLQTNVGKHTPPTFLWHTFKDEAVPVRDSLEFALALEKKDVPFELHIWPNGEHGLSLANEDVCIRGGDSHCEQWFEMSVKWLKRLFYKADKEAALPPRALYTSKL